MQSGSVQATDRLMKELRDIYKSESYKRGECRVTLLSRCVLDMKGSVCVCMLLRMCPRVYVCVCVCVCDFVYVCV